MIIGICDDDVQERERLLDICTEVMKKEYTEYTLVEFDNGKAVLDYEEKIDLLLLDIEMPELSGIELKNRLQQSDKVEMIIYVSSHSELMREAFGLHVIGFARKGMEAVQLPDMLRSSVQMKEPHLMIEGQADSRTVRYIEAYYGYVKMICEHGETDLHRITLDSLEETLAPYDFVRIHRKYLVNMRKIDRLHDNEIEIGGVKLPISVRMKTKVRKAYDSFARRNARYC
ncbi:MAG: response regulator transcription factor [Lachnospiraceae bacterium]|nr:response regulator transcription factor [Lachnospiraceae bacterium]